MIPRNIGIGTEIKSFCQIQVCIMVCNLGWGGDLKSGKVFKKEKKEKVKKNRKTGEKKEEN